MSNYLAIATVTLTLEQRLLALMESLDAAQVHAAHASPARFQPQDRGANVFLYQVTPNSAIALNDLPARGRTGDGPFVNRPQVALDLHYLVTFLDEDQLLAQRLLGAFLTDIHARPYLSRTEIENAAKTDLVHLAASNLHLQADTVRLQHVPMGVEELSRLWAIFPQVAYRLSCTMTASLVVLEADVATATAKPIAGMRISPPQAGASDFVAGGDGAAERMFPASLARKSAVQP